MEVNFLTELVGYVMCWLFFVWGAVWRAFHDKCSCMTGQTLKYASKHA